MQQCNGEWVGIALVDQAANDISAFVAEEQRIQYVYLAVWRNALACVFGYQAPQLVYGPAQGFACVGRQVVEGRRQAEVGNQIDQCLVRAFGGRVINTIRGQLAIKILGGHRWPHKQEVVMKIVEEFGKVAEREIMGKYV